MTTPNKTIRLLFASIILVLGQSVKSQTLSQPMSNAIDACTNMSAAMASMSTEQLKAANRILKAADIVDFGDLRLEKGEDISVDGHFIFDEEFVDSLIVNRKVIDFARKYAKRRSSRGSTGAVGRIKMTTKALQAGKKATWKTVNSNNAEYAIVAEPGGLFTMTIRDDNGTVLYAETVNNKKGESVRKAQLQLPDKATRIHIEVKNNGKNDASFALLGN